MGASKEGKENLKKVNGSLEDKFKEGHGFYKIMQFASDHNDNSYLDQE